MRVVVEFDMVDMSMHKHEAFFNYIVKKYQAGVRSAKIIDPYTNHPCCGGGGCKDPKYDDKAHS